MRRVVAIVDGEHYPPVVRDALEEIDDLVVAAVLVGGTEKLRGGDPEYGVPLEPSLEDAIERHLPDLVLDLSDEPVLGPPERLALASRALALGVPYEGPDFRFDPPVATAVDVPTLAVIGTGMTKLRNTSRPPGCSSYASGSVSTRSGVPSCHPPENTGGAGASAGLPSGAPPSTHRVMRAISSSRRRRSPTNAPCPGSGSQGGIARRCTAAAIARAYGRAEA